MFRRSLDQSCLPSEWKKALVVPIFKKSSRLDPLNYRPISLTSVVCKVMERIIARELVTYLEEAELLAGDQFGFRVGRSTEDQLLLTYDYVTKAVDSGAIVDLILFDFSKAFDVVCHQLLLEKLECLGVGGCLLGWIGEFLVGRSMQVVVDGQCSFARGVHSGVPQGSVLGPLLFIIFVNNLTPALTCKSKLFADDLKLYLEVPRFRNYCPDILSTFQSDISTVLATSESWGLSMNYNKCVSLRFGSGNLDTSSWPSYYLNGSPISSDQSAVDLGVKVDTSLRFHDHVRVTVNKAAGLAANLLKSTCNRDRDFMIALFVGHIRPILEYCSCLWNTGFLGDLRLLESVQRRWTKQIDGIQDLSYGARLRTLDLFSVKGRLVRSDLLKVWKLFNGGLCFEPSVFFDMAPRVGTRGHPLKLAVPRSRLECRRRFFAVRVVKLWNSLPERVVCASSVEAFKAGLRSSLEPELFSFVD